MNFEEWFKRGTPEEKPCFGSDAEMGWDACKKEVLTILEKHKLYSSEEGDIIQIKCIEEIEKL